MSNKSYNPQKARTKYACPIWVDAFLRDTLDLEADEFGAYHLIIYAMWSREDCNMPNDDRKLARVSRCSTRLWKSRIRPALEPFFEIENGVWINTRLRKEAVKTEKFLRDQSDRKRRPDNKSDTCALPEGTYENSQETAKKSDKPLENKDQSLTVDSTAEVSGEHPTQETKIPRYKDDDDSAGADLTFRERVLVAAGHDASGVTANGRMIAGKAEFAEFDKARTDLGLSESEAVEVVAEIAARKRDGPPNSLKYFTDPLRQYAGAKNAPAVTAIAPTQLNAIPGGHDGKRNHDTDRIQRIVSAAATGTSRQDWG
ncbi:MAG: YdaU family protein [Sulfitobacter sp.]|uniref:YdaU family protein n=1 Tax=Alphaproteobacteria TaxID=28211 RepID=UPI003264CB4E